MKSHQIIPKQALSSILHHTNTYVVKLFCVKVLKSQKLVKAFYWIEKKMKGKGCVYLHILIMFAILLAN